MIFTLERFEEVTCYLKSVSVLSMSWSWRLDDFMRY